MKVHPGIRVNKNYEDNVWFVENVITRRKFRFDNPVLVNLLIELSNIPKAELDTKQVVDNLKNKYKYSSQEIERVISSFINCGILVNNLDENSEWGAKVSQNGEKYQWVESMDYHLVSYDYPFLDYTTDARHIDKERMTGYTSQQRDENRYKTYENIVNRVPAPEPSKILCPANLEEVIFRKIENVVLTKELLLKTMSMTFGSIGYYRPPWENAEKVLRKTSPSGGARHPSEGYVLVLDIKELEPGWYHYSVKSNELVLISSDINREEIGDILFGPYRRADFNVQAITILTSIFERNMYRYREPRTFRSIHMDIGHLSATLEYVAASYGIKSFPHYGLKETEVERKLNLPFFEEGVFMGISLGY